MTERQANSKAMWGTVSADGGRWTLHYPRRPESSQSAITCTGYGPDVFEGFAGPVIRFDKAPIEAVLESIRHIPCIEGHNTRHAFDSRRPVTLAEYLDSKRALGIPVESWPVTV